MWLRAYNFVGDPLVDFLRLLAARTDRMRASEVRELLKWVTEDVISFGGGLPDPATFPTREELVAMAEFVAESKDKALQYGPTEGIRELREEIAKFCVRHGIDTEPEGVLVTTGSQQALDILGRIFINQRDPVIVELPTYIAAINAFTLYRPSFVGIPMDSEGMRVDLLEERVKALIARGQKPKFVYTIPTCQNPAGLSMSMDRRKYLMEVASRYDLLLVEDDPYSYILFDDVRFERLKSLDQEGRVIYMSTFSKIFVPGLRLGWVAAEPEIVRVMALAKQSMDLCSSAFAQYVALYALKERLIEKRIPDIVRRYRVKRDAMLKALEQHMPEGTTWTKPVGGMFVFATVDERIDTKKMLYKTVKEYKVAYVPGASFFVDGTGWNTMRLNYTYPSLEQIDEGVRRLSLAIEDELKLATAEAGKAR